MLKFLKKYYFLLLPILVTALALVFHMVRFIVNDDIGLMNIAESFKTNAHSEQLLFMSVIYGYILKLLYTLIPAVNWFLTLELSVLGVGFIALYRLSQGFEYKLISASVLTILHFFLLANLTFTSIAFVLLTSALLWFFVNVKELNKESIKHIVLTLILLLLGLGMRRDDTFYFTVLLFLPLFGLAFLKKRMKLLPILLVFIMLAASNYGFGAVQGFYNQHLEGNEYFTQFNRVRSDANDGGLFNYKAHKEALEEAGLSKNDYKLASHWVYADKNVFSAEAMKTIGEVRGFNEKYNTDVKDILKQMLEAKTLLVFVAALLLLTLTAFIRLKGNRLEVLATFLATMAGLGFIYFRRRGVERVACPIVLCGILVLLFLFLMNHVNIKEPKKALKFGVAALCILAIAAGFAYNVYQAKAVDKTAQRYRAIVDYAEENTDKLFISDAYAIDKYRVYYANQHITEVGANHDFKLRSLLGNWNLYTAYYYDNLEQLGLSAYGDCLIKALLEDDVCFVTKKFKSEDIVKYFDENYDLKVGYDTVYAFDGLKTAVYHFYVE